MQQNEPAGGEFIPVLIAGRGGAGQRHRRGAVHRERFAAPGCRGDNLRAEGNGERREPGGRRDLVQAQFAAASCFPECSQRVKKVRGNLGKCVHNRRVRNWGRSARQARRAAAGS
jgi:hypothetical protein